MGLKRKADSFESDYASLQQHQSSPPPMTFSSITSSPDSMVTEPFHSTFNYHLLPSSNAPWHNSRTRKRTRDNRPDETQIHQDTVRKLFEAQKPQPQAEDAMMMDSDDCYHTSWPTPPVEEGYTSDGTNSVDGSSIPDLTVPEANQRSLHNFFSSQHAMQFQQNHQHHNMSHAPTASSSQQRSLRDFFRHQQPVQVHHDFPPPPPPSHCLTPVTTEDMAIDSHQPQGTQTPSVRPPTPQELSAGAPAPVVVQPLRERPSMGFLGSINTSPAPSRDGFEGENIQNVTLCGALATGGSGGGGGGYLPCDFRTKADFEMMMAGRLSGCAGGDAMVMG